MTISASPVVGIDVVKASLDVAFLRDEQIQHAEFKITPTGFKKLHRWLKRQTEQTTQVCLEATGIYGQAVARYLHEAGYAVSIINLAQNKQPHCKQRGIKTKKTFSCFVASHGELNPKRLKSMANPACGHQWKLVAERTRAGCVFSQQQRAIKVSSSASKDGKWRLTKGASSNGQRCSAGWSSGE